MEQKEWEGTTKYINKMKKPGEMRIVKSKIGHCTKKIKKEESNLA